MVNLPCLARKFEKTLMEELYKQSELIQQLLDAKKLYFSKTKISFETLLLTCRYRLELL